MLLKRKKKKLETISLFKKEKPIINDVFGEMVYAWSLYWQATSKIKLTLWDNTYSIDLRVVAINEENEKCCINELQENAYKKFKEEIIKKQEEIEAVVEEYYNTNDKKELIEKFIPEDLQISLKGECALIADDTDDEDEEHSGLAVLIYPILKIYSHDEYSSYIFGGGDYFIEKEIYGE